MGRVADVKVDVVDWKVPFTQEPLIADGIRMATAPDIFASKCDALLTRKAEKDFVDIAMIASRFSLAELFATLRKRYFYLTAGAVAALLLKKEAIERDLTIRYFDPYGFDYFAEQLRGQLEAYEAEIKEQKLSRENDHMQKIQSLIEQKRKKT